MELHTLPPELFCQGIFKFLTPSELLQTESVSRWWQDLCREPTLWHNYCLQEMGYPVTNTSNHNTENNIEGEKKMALDPDIEKLAEDIGWRAAYKEFASIVWSQEYSGNSVFISQHGRTATTNSSWIPTQINKVITHGKHIYHLAFSGGAANMAVGVAPPGNVNTLSTYWCYFEDGNFYSKGVGYGGNVRSNFLTAVLTVEVDMDNGIMTYKRNGVTIEDVMCSNISGPVCLTISNCHPGVVRLVSSRHAIPASSAEAEKAMLKSQ